MADRNAVEQDYNSGMKYKDLADKYGVTINTIKSWKQRYGWDRKGAHTTEKGCAQKKNALEDRKREEKENSLTVGLTEKERLFCEVYVRNFNATQAAIKAGYSSDSAKYIGYELLTKPHLRDYVAYLKEQRKRSILLGEDDILERYMRIAFADITDFVEFGRVLVPVMTMYGPLKAKNPVSGEDEVVMREVNDVRLKESYEVDGGLISQIKQGKDGASFKLEDRQKALEWLSNYFSMNPQDKHKRDYDDKRLAIETKKLEMAQHPGGEDPGEPEDDGFIEALSGTAAADWGSDDEE